MKFTKEICYVLGYFWADGYISETKKPTKKNPDNIYYKISIEIVKEDGDCILEVFKKTGLDWKINERKRNNSERIQSCFSLSSFKNNKRSMEFLNLLLSSGYKNRSGSHYQILKKIPKNFRKYWYRGFFDGDGCINVKKMKNSKSFRLYFYGPDVQDWSSIFELFKNLDIKYKHQIISRKNGKHKSSHIVSSFRDDIVKFFEYLYPNFKYDIGLYRKYEKLNLCKNYKSKIKSNRKKSKENCDFKFFS